MLLNESLPPGCISNDISRVESVSNANKLWLSCVGNLSIHSQAFKGFRPLYFQEKRFPTMNVNPAFGSVLTALFEKERDAGDIRDMWLGHLLRAAPRMTSNTSGCNRSPGRTTDRSMSRASATDTPSSRTRLKVFWVRRRSWESGGEERSNLRREDEISRLFKTARLRRHLDVRHSRACRVISRCSGGISVRESQRT